MYHLSCIAWIWGSIGHIFKFNKNYFWWISQIYTFRKFKMLTKNRVHWEMFSFRCTVKFTRKTLKKFQKWSIVSHIFLKNIYFWIKDYSSINDNFVWVPGWTKNEFFTLIGFKLYSKRIFVVWLRHILSF